MKILIVTPIFPPEIGGPANYVIELLKRLPPQISIEVVSFARETTAAAKNIHFVNVSGNVLKRQINLFLSCLKFGQKADIFYLMEPAVVGLAGLLAAKILRKKIIVKYVGDPSWELARSIKKTNLDLDSYLKNNRDYLYQVSRFVFNNCDRIIVATEYMSEVLTKYYQIKKNKIRLVRNSAEKLKEIPKKISNQIIFSGRLVNWKGVDTALYALEILKKKKLKFKFVIVGDGPEKNNLEKLSKSLSLDKDVVFVGKVTSDRSRQLIAQSEILVIDSQYESLTHVVLEAMMAKTVVVASNMLGMEAVIHNETGLKVPYGDVTRLATALEELLNNRVKIKKMAEKGLLKATKEFFWDVNIGKLEKVFHEFS